LVSPLVSLKCRRDKKPPSATVLRLALIRRTQAVTSLAQAGLIAEEQAREESDALALGARVADGGDVGREEEGGRGDSQEKAAQADQRMEFAVPDRQHGGVVTQDHAVDVRCERQMVRVRPEAQRAPLAHVFEELLAVRGR